MPNPRKRREQSSSSSSSSSSQGQPCHHGSNSTECGECHGNSAQSDYREQCPPQIAPEPCPGMSGYEIYQKYKSAVVRIHSQTVLTTSDAPGARPPGSVPAGTTPDLAWQANTATLHLHSNGFFIDKKVIIAPAHVALLPPNGATGYNRYPFTVNKITTPPLYDGAAMTRAGRFTADVFDVNGGGHSYTYEIELLGLDASGDIAIFYINRKSPANVGLPCLKRCHPFFKFACSRSSRSGLDVFAIGDPYASSVPRAPRAILGGVPPQAGTPNATQFGSMNAPNGSLVLVSGKVQTPRHLAYLGFAQQELIAVDMNIAAYKSGLPLINQYGQVLGMQTMATTGATPFLGPGTTGYGNNTFHPVGDGIVAGPSSFFMLRSIKHLISTLRGKASPFVTSVVDPFGNFYRYIHGYLGVSWEVFTGEHYMSYINANGFVVPRYQADGVTPAVTPFSKEIIGLRVRALASASNPPSADSAPVGIIVPGPQNPATILGSFSASPLEGLVAYNDVITHANLCPLGDIEKQIPLSFITWRLQAGEQIALGVRRISQNYEGVNAVSVILADFPAFMDYPWYYYPTFVAIACDGIPATPTGGVALDVFPSFLNNDVMVPAI